MGVRSKPMGESSQETHLTHGRALLAHATPLS
jgi:hypothetical protein